MPFEYEELGPLDEMMAYVNEDGSNLHFAVKRLNDYLEGVKFEAIRAQLPENTRAFLAKGRDVDQKRMLSLTFKERQRPVIFCEIEGQHMLIDGTHRVARAIFNGRTWVWAWFVPEIVWREFLITNLPELGFDQVLNLGTSGIQHRKRNRANGVQAI